MRVFRFPRIERLGILGNIVFLHHARNRPENPSFSYMRLVFAQENVFFAREQIDIEHRQAQQDITRDVQKGFA